MLQQDKPIKLKHLEVIRFLENHNGHLLLRSNAFQTKFLLKIRSDFYSSKPLRKIKPQQCGMPTLALMLSDVSAALFGTLLGGPIVSLLPVEPFVYPLPKFFRCSLKNYNIDMR